MRKHQFLSASDVLQAIAQEAADVHHHILPGKTSPTQVDVAARWM